MMKVLVTGATGFIGSHLVRKLIERGDEVTGLARKSSHVEELRRLDCKIVYGDLKDKDSLQRAVDGMDLVYHAGVVRGGGNWTEHEDATVRGTERLLELSLTQGVKRFVHISSIAVYGMDQLQNNAVVDENCPFEQNPGHYRRAKIESERLVAEFQQKGLATVILRPGIVFGPRGKILFGNIGYSLSGGKLFIIIGKSDRLLPLTYVENTVEGIVLAGTREAAVGHAYNLVDGEVPQKAYLRQLRRMMCSHPVALHIPFTFVYSSAFLIELLRGVGVLAWNSLTTSRSGVVTQYRKNLHFDATKAERDLNWQPSVNLEEGLRRTLEHYGESSRRSESTRSSRLWDRARRHRVGRGHAVRR